jgi:hypothetical protein
MLTGSLRYFRYVTHLQGVLANRGDFLSVPESMGYAQRTLRPLHDHAAFSVHVTSHEGHTRVTTSVCFQLLEEGLFPISIDIVGVVAN